jgi:putative FmdB family regulatory protein
VLNRAPIAEDHVPTYQYVCTDCQNDLEAVQSFSEPSLSICPSCGGKLRKRFGAVGVVFKGSGFYRNDSRSDGRGGSGERKSDGEKAASETKAESKSETKAEGKSEGKSESKSEPKSDSSSKSSPSGSSGSSSSGSSGSSGSGSKATSAA